jgi:hypothetical protein
MGASAVPLQPEIVVTPLYVPVSMYTTSPAVMVTALARLAHESFGEFVEVPVFAAFPATEQ